MSAPSVQRTYKKAGIGWHSHHTMNKGANLIVLLSLCLMSFAPYQPGRPANPETAGSAAEEYSNSIQYDSSVPSQVASCATSGELIIANGESCCLDAGSYTFDSVLVQTGGTLVVKGNPTSNQGVTINTSTLLVEAGGRISADGTGYAGTTGKGSNPGGGSCAWMTGEGGGYGGTGESGAGSGGAGYGSVTNPMDLGSAGGCGQYLTSRTAGGAGGGALKLVVSGTLQLDSEISADGASGRGRSGGGAGGSIWIETNTISGSGVIRANSGAGRDGGGDGAGGRVAVSYTASALPLDSLHIQTRGAYTQNNDGRGGGTTPTPTPEPLPPTPNPTEPTCDDCTPTPTPTKVAYLTFDDQPNGLTPQVLSKLQQYGDIKATFFVIGKHIREIGYMPQIVSAGHITGLHSMNHWYPWYEDPAYATPYDQLTDLINLVSSYTGVQPNLWRAPGGYANWEDTLPEPYNQTFYRYAWDINPQDIWDYVGNADYIYDQYLAEMAMNARDSIIILLHGWTPDALDGGGQFEVKNPAASCGALEIVPQLELQNVALLVLIPNIPPNEL